MAPSDLTPTEDLLAGQEYRIAVKFTNTNSISVEKFHVINITKNAGIKYTSVPIEISSVGTRGVGGHGMGALKTIVT